MAVRNEAVRLELIDDFSTNMAKAAAATALLNRELNSLSANAVKSTRTSQTIARDNDNIARSAGRAETSINQLTGRLRLFADLAAIFGSTVAPIGAVMIPAVAGLANQFGVAALAGGTAIMAFQGVGDALKAVNDAALEPTAENLEAARIAMERLSPAAQEMVSRLQELRPVLEGLRDTAAEGMFPGIIDGLDELETRLPDLERIISNVSSTLGSMLRDAGESLASPKWDDFFDFLATDATTTLAAMGHVVGDLAHGFAELWMAFDPLNDDFSSWMEDVAAGFDTWASGLAQTEGFREFIDYVRTSGPQVADTFASLADAVLQIVEASAPLGGPVLQALESVAKVIAAIADSNLGTPIMAGVTAMALLSRATKTYEAIAATTWGSKAKANIVGMNAALRATSTEQQRAAMSAAQLERGWRSIGAGVATIGKGAAVLAALTLATTGAADGLGLTNTMTLGLMGTLGGPFGAVLGTATGLFLDAKSAVDRAADSTDRFNAALDSGSDKLVRLEIERLTAQLNSLSDIDPWEFGKWAEAGGLGAPEIDKIRSEIDQLRAALDAPNTGRGLASMLAGNLAPALGMTADQFDLAAMGAEDFAKALQGLAGFLDRREALRNYQQALDDFVKSVKDNGKSFDTTTEKGRANEAALDGIADAAIQAASHLKGLDRVRTLTQAADDIKALAKQLGIPPKLIQEIIDRLEKAARTDAKPKVEPQGIPQANKDVDGVQKKFSVLDQFTAEPGIEAQDHASGPISWVQKAIDRLDGDKATVTIETIRRTILQTTSAPANVAHNLFGGDTGADGGSVPKTGLPYADRHLYMLADGEEIISNRYGQADRHRSLLKAINANAMAGGGTTGGAAARYLDSSRADIALNTFARTVERATSTADQSERADKRREAAKEVRDRLREKAEEILRGEIDETRTSLQDLRQRFAEIRDAVAGNFLSNDPWYTANPNTSQTSASLFLMQLRNQTTQAQAFKSELQQLRDLGLDGPLFQYIAQSGDFALADSFSQMNERQVHHAERLWSQRQQAAMSAGRFTADAQVGAKLDRTNDLLDDMRTAFRGLTDHRKGIALNERTIARVGRVFGEEVADELNDLAAKAKRKAGAR